MQNSTKKNRSGLHESPKTDSYICILRPLQVKKLRSFHHSNVHVCGYGYSLALNLCNEDESLL